MNQFCLAAYNELCTIGAYGQMICQMLLQSETQFAETRANPASSARGKYCLRAPKEKNYYYYYYCYYYYYYR